LPKYYRRWKFKKSFVYRLLQDVCVKKDFDDLYNKITDEGRELKVVHGGVVEVTYQPLPSARNITLQEYPFGAPLPEKQAPTEQEAPAEAPVQEGTQVCRFCLGSCRLKLL